MAESTVTSKGQITLPKSIRDGLHLRPGDKVEFVIGENGRVEMLPITRSVRELKGMIKRPTRPVSIEEMNRAIRLRGGRA
jgi:AbrB family looped-hinge helix DNA binding protein